MTSPIKTKGVTLDNTFDPWSAGTDKAPATGITEDGTDICNKYAPLKYGSAAPATGIKSKNVDLNAIFAKKGTAAYELPFDGDTFSSNAAARGHAELDLSMKNNGTYTIVRSGTSITTVTLASGSWLPSGGSVSEYSVQFTASQSGDTIADGSNTISNGAATRVELTTTRMLKAMSDAAHTSDRASATAICNVKLYRSGVLMSTTTFSLQTNANGN